MTKSHLGHCPVLLVRTTDPREVLEEPRDAKKSRKRLYYVPVKSSEGMHSGCCRLHWDYLGHASTCSTDIGGRHPQCHQHP